MLKIILIVSILILIMLLFPKKKNKEEIKYVFINKKSKKYHKEKCPYAKNLKSMSLEDAVKEEYAPCKVCNEKNV